MMSQLPPAVTEEKLKSATEYYLNSSTATGGRALHRWSRSRGGVTLPLIFMATWLIAGAGIALQLSSHLLPVTEIWQNLHTLKADLPFEYQTTQRDAAGKETEVIVRVKEHDVILRPDAASCQRYEAFKTARDNYRLTWATVWHTLRTYDFSFKFILFGIFLLSYLLTIRKFRMVRAEDLSRLTVACCFVCAEVLWVAGISNSPILLRDPMVRMVLEIIPLALFPALMINLFNLRMAFCTAFFQTLIYTLVYTIPDPKYEIFYYALITSLASLWIFRRINRRIGFFTSGVMLALLLFILGILSGLSRDILPVSRESIARIMLSSFAIGVGTAIICTLILPVIEFIFRIPSDLTLTNLGTVNTPLMQRMRREAPGTYAHSIAVADLATNAAIAIGADAELINVMALYHDIGKLYAPQYFAENLNGHGNAHDRLLPHESAMIIREHVVFGQELAKKYGLSSLIIPAIAQHHGDSLIGIFFKKAQDRAAQQGDPAPQKNDFRYSGPKPLSREVAILSLADACEAAVRALFSQNYNSNKLTQQLVSETIAQVKDTEDSDAPLDDRLTELYQRLINSALKPSAVSIKHDIEQRLCSVIDGRVREQQLEEAELTTHELGVIRRSFLETIVNKQHARPEYMR